MFYFVSCFRVAQWKLESIRDGTWIVPLPGKGGETCITDEASSTVLGLKHVKIILTKRSMETAPGKAKPKKPGEGKTQEARKGPG